MENRKDIALLPFHPKTLSDEEFSAYEAEFKKALSDPLYKNIALPGPYGADKSSVMEKVKREQQEYGKKWITISLSTFDGKNDERTCKNDSIQNALEAEILRQMAHKIGESISMVPESNIQYEVFSCKSYIDVVITVLILVFIILTAYLAKTSSDLFSSHLSLVEVLASIAWLLITGTGLYHLVHTNVISKTVKRVKILEMELETTPPDSTSLDKRHVDEIASLLNASKIDAVIFEDLDRFDSTAILEKMRRLNSLANDSRLRGREKRGKRAAKPPLKFFFLVRDGVFENPDDRTKFFDYIIPIIPYINANSALDIFRNALKGVGISVNEGFLYQLSSYINDPRIIHDIANETYHYKNVLFKKRPLTKENSEHLVALLAYKALFPKDFALLQNERGYLYEVLNGKRRLITKLKKNNESERNTLQYALEKINFQLAVSEYKLLCIFDEDEMRDIAQQIGLHGNTENFRLDSFLNAVRKNKQASQKFNNLKHRLSKNKQYQKQFSQIEDDANSQKKIIQSRLKALNNKDETWEAMTIKQLIGELPDANVLFEFTGEDIARKQDFEELSMDAVLNSPSFPMIRFLVSSGYIDESYRRYIS